MPSWVILIHPPEDSMPEHLAGYRKPLLPLEETERREREEAFKRHKAAAMAELTRSSGPIASEKLTAAYNPLIGW